MQVLGIDPGSQRLGYGVVVETPNGLQHITHGVIEPGRGTTSQRLEKIARALNHIVDAYKPDMVATETPFVGKYPRAAIVLGQAVGIVSAIAWMHT